MVRAALAPHTGCRSRSPLVRVARACHCSALFALDFVARLSRALPGAGFLLFCFFVLCVVRGMGFVSLNLFLVLRACVLALSTSTKCIVRELP